MMSGLRANLSSAFRKITGLGKSSKLKAPAAKSTTLPQRSDPGLSPRGTADVLSSASMAPRGKAPGGAEGAKAGHPLHQLTPRQSVQPPPQSVLPTPEAIGVPRRREQPK